MPEARMELFALAQENDLGAESGTTMPRPAAFGKAARCRIYEGCSFEELH
jgi:hypothetical protein